MEKTHLCTFHQSHFAFSPPPLHGNVIDEIDAGFISAFQAQITEKLIVLSPRNVTFSLLHFPLLRIVRVHPLTANGYKPFFVSTCITGQQ